MFKILTQHYLNQNNVRTSDFDHKPKFKINFYLKRVNYKIQYQITYYDS